MKKFSLVLGSILLGAFVFGCSHGKPAVGSRDVSKAKISLTRTSCYGKCPVYSITIYGTGRVEFEGFANTKVLGKQEIVVPVDSVRILVAELEQQGYFSLNDRYEEYQMTDLATVNTEAEIDGIIKKITHYKGDLTTPQILSDIEKRIDEIATVRQWLE
ncbi:MAG: DUF6438 domain-containing protein [Candidatus Kapaibacterium sp.]